MKKRTILIAGLVIYGILMVILAFVLSRSKGKKEEPVGIMETGDNKTSSKEDEKYDFIIFKDVDTNKNSEALHQAFVVEFDDYLKQNAITDFTPHNSETITYAIEGETGTVEDDRTVVIPVRDDEILSDFSFTFTDQSGDKHICSYSKFDNTYSFQRYVEEEEPLENEASASDSALDYIDVEFEDEAISFITENELDAEQITAAIKAGINDAGMLGEIEKVYVMSGVKSEDGEAFSLNAISNNTDNTPITVIYQNGKYAAWFQ